MLLRYHTRADFTKCPPFASVFCSELHYLRGLSNAEFLIIILVEFGIWRLNSQDMSVTQGPFVSQEVTFGYSFVKLFEENE